MKKLNSKTYSYVSQVSQYGQCKVIETHDGFLLNTVYHNDKRALNPTTQQIYNSSSTNQYIQNGMFLERANSSINYMKDGFDENAIITDKYNENTYYSVSGQTLENACNFILKYTEDNGIINELKKTYSTLGQYLCQTENFLYFSYASGTGNKLIYKVDKETLTSTTIYTYYSLTSSSSYVQSGSYRPIVLKETATSIYMLILTTNSSSTYAIKPVVIKIDKIEDTVTGLVTLANFTCSKTDYFICQNVYDFIKISETVYGVIFKTPNNSTTADSYFSYVQVDISDEENVTATVSSIPIVDFTLPTNSYYTYTSPQRIWVYEHEGKQYLNALRGHYQTSDTTSNVAYNCLYTFEIQKDENNIPVQLKQISIQQGSTWSSRSITNMLLSKDRSILLLNAGNQYLRIYKFDANTCNYQLANELNITSKIYRYGFDSLNRLWILNQSYNVEVYGLTDYSSYSIEFEKAEYAYKGTDIETYVVFKCFDMTKSRVNGTFTLSIEGAAKFTENYDTRITVTLSENDTEDLIVPIIITGGGRVTVYPTLISS